MKKFKISEMKSIKIKNHSKLIKIDSKRFFKQQENLSKALSEAILSGDLSSFQDIIQGYLSVINKDELARVSKVPIATIRRVAAGSNYNIETLLKITAAINKAA